MRRINSENFTHVIVDYRILVEQTRKFLCEMQDKSHGVIPRSDSVVTIEFVIELSLSCQDLNTKIWAEY